MWGMPELNSMGDEWFPTASSIYFLAHQNDRAVIYTQVDERSSNLMLIENWQ